MSELLKLNVNEHTEKKGQLTYLSWAWAWAKVLELDPLAEWEAIEYARADGTIAPCMYLPDGTVMVKTRVTLKGKTRYCTLPVMDNKNAALKNPDARKISDAIMRCMTKAISMHGLGLYIYAGEDLPESEAAETPAPAPTPEKKRTGVAQDVLDTTPALPPETTEQLDHLARIVKEDFDAYGAQAAFERIDAEKLDNVEKIYLSTKLDSTTRNKIKAYSIAFHSTKPNSTWRAGA